MMSGRKQELFTLAERYPQLYLDPDTAGSEEACDEAVRKGAAVERNNLDHFHGDDRDTLEEMRTPAGPVEVLTLHDRADFELFLRIIACRCRPKKIPKTQGASTLDGIVNWPKIESHRKAFYREEAAKGNLLPDWGAEFRSFTADRRNYRDTLIVLSHWPYSAVSAEQAGMGEEEWLEASRMIRLYHELTHVICRRLYPGQIDAVWDELCADAVGIYAALGRYDRTLEETFLGIADGKYAGGRLGNYVDDPSDRAALDALAAKSDAVLRSFEELFCEHEKEIRDGGPGSAADRTAAGRAEGAFAMIEVLEGKQAELWNG